MRRKHSQQFSVMSIFALIAGMSLTSRADDAPVSAPAEAPRKSLATKLAVRVDLNPKNVPLRAYLEGLGKEHGFEVRFEEKELAAQSIPLDRLISADFRAYPLKAGLVRILRKYGLEPRIVDDVLIIGTMPPQRNAPVGIVPPPPAAPAMVVNRRIRVIRAIDGRIGDIALSNPLFRPVVAVPGEEDKAEQVRTLLDDANESTCRQVARESFYETIGWGDSPDVVRNHCLELLADQIHKLTIECNLSDLQQRKLRLAGQGDIEMVLTLAREACERFSDKALTGVQTIEMPWNEIGSLQSIRQATSFEVVAGPQPRFNKIRDRVLTQDQKAILEAITGLRAIGGIVRTRSTDGPGIREVFLTSRAVDAKVMAHLAALNTVERLSLSSTKITDADLVPLKAFTNLTSLDLSVTEIGDAGLAHLEGLTALEELDLGRTTVSDHGLASLRNMRKLRVLDLSQTVITDDGLERLGIHDMVNLRELRLSNTSIGSRGVALLAGLHRLERLELNGINLSNGGLTPLSELNAMRVLFLDGSEINDEDLEALSNLSNLERLDLQRTHLTNKGLSHLKGLKQLRSLDLWKTGATKGSAEALERTIPQLRVIQ